MVRCAKAVVEVIDGSWPESVDSGRVLYDTGVSWTYSFNYLLVDMEGYADSDCYWCGSS